MIVINVSQRLLIVFTDDNHYRNCKHYKCNSFMSIDRLMLALFLYLYPKKTFNCKSRKK